MIQGRVSYTELDTLAQCEKKYSYKYLLRQKSGQTPAMWKGSLVHDVVGPWWDSERDIHEILDEQLAAAGADTPLDQAIVDDTRWLLDRYQRVYWEDRANKSLRVIGQELKFQQQLPKMAADVVLVGYVDQLVLDRRGGLWLVERKTMNDWQRLELLPADRQIDLYIWLARSCGLPVQGVLFDAIRTYRWKAEKPTLREIEDELVAGLHGGNWALATKGALRIEAKRLQELHPGVERPAEESVELRWVDRTDEQINETLDEVSSALSRRAQLAFGAKPVRNIGRHCHQCPFKNECWDSLAFPNDIDIEES